MSIRRVLLRLSLSRTDVLDLQYGLRQAVGTDESILHLVDADGKRLINERINRYHQLHARLSREGLEEPEP